MKSSLYSSRYLTFSHFLLFIIAKIRLYLKYFLLSNFSLLGPMTLWISKPTSKKMTRVLSVLVKILPMMNYLALEVSFFLIINQKFQYLSDCTLGYLIVIDLQTTEVFKQKIETLKIVTTVSEIGQNSFRSDPRQGISVQI